MLKLNRIYNKDCVEGMKQLDKNLIDLTITSPPYDDLRKYTGYEWNFEAVAKELYRVTKKGGVVVWVVGDATVNGSETGTSFRQALYFKELGFNLHDTMIWKKTNPFNFGSNNCYIQSFEYMFVFSKGKPKTMNFLRDRSNKTYAKGKKIKSVRRDKKSDILIYGDSENDMDKLGKRYNVWEIPGSREYKGHKATFPETLVKDHMITWSNKGDLVLDPFMGSGTTAKVSVLNDRNFVGFEISKEYYQVSKERVLKYKALRSSGV